MSKAMPSTSRQRASILRRQRRGAAHDGVELVVREGEREHDGQSFARGVSVGIVFFYSSEHAVSALRISAPWAHVDGALFRSCRYTG
jgi:hypothetical protein